MRSRRPFPRVRSKRCFAIALATVVCCCGPVALGCGAAPATQRVTQTTIVRRVVQRNVIVVRRKTETRTVFAAPPTIGTTPSSPSPAPAAASYSTLSGTYVSLDYPDSWTVESDETPKGAYYDTTIRNPADSR